MNGYPENHVYSNHLQVFQSNSSMTSIRRIESKYEKYKIKRLSYKRNRERAVGAGRRFKLLVKDRVIMVLVSTGFTLLTR